MPKISANLENVSGWQRLANRNVYDFQPRHPRIYHIVLEAFLRLTLTNKQEALLFELI